MAALFRGLSVLPPSVVTTARLWPLPRCAPGHRPAGAPPPQAALAPRRPARPSRQAAVANDDGFGRGP